MLHRHARPAVAGAYTAGTVAGALVTGAALLVLGGLVSPIPAQARGTAATLAIILLALHALGILCLRLPQRKYQIDRETFNDPPAKAGFRFAFELGTGVRTYVTTAAPYAVALIVLLCLPDSLGGAAIRALAAAVGFGLGRARIVAAQSWRRTVAVGHPQRWLTAASLVSLGVALLIAVSYVAQA